MKFERHLPYFVVIEAFRASKGCALCDLEAEGMRRHLDSILHESVNDPKVRRELKESHGYCHRHAHQLATFDDALGVAILFRDCVRSLLDSLEEPHESRLAGLFRHRQSARGGSGRCCPACLAQLEMRSRHIDVLAESLGADEAMRTVFESSKGLCAPHFHDLLENRNLTPDIRSLATRVAKEKFSSLLAELEELCRKHDYQFSGEKIGAEGDSWLRAVEMLTGKKEVF